MLVHAGLGNYRPGKKLEEYSLEELTMVRPDYQTQYFPDAVNHKNFPSSICRKGELYQTKTEFRFVKG